MGLQTAHIYCIIYKKNNNKMKLQFEKTQIKVRTNKLLNAIERERERERERGKTVPWL